MKVNSVRYTCILIRNFCWGRLMWLIAPGVGRARYASDYRDCVFLRLRGAQIFQKSRNHLRILFHLRIHTYLAPLYKTKLLWLCGARDFHSATQTNISGKCPDSIVIRLPLPYSSFAICHSWIVLIVAPRRSSDRFLDWIARFLVEY